MDLLREGVGLARVTERAARAAQMAADHRGQAAVALGRPGTLAVRPDAAPIPGDRLLNIADTWLGMHCYFPSEQARHAAVLWAAAQHFRSPKDQRRLLWGKFARLFFAAEPDSGKSTAMALIGSLCAPWFFGLDTNPTAPGLCATIEQEGAVVAIDEFHRTVGPKGTANRAVVSILCSGYDRSGTYLNGRGGKATRVPVFGAVMVGGRKNPLLTSAKEEITDLVDRSIVYEMVPPAAGAAELKPIMEDGSTEAAGARIGANLAQWAAQEAASERFTEAIKTARDTATEIGLTTRGKEIWVPLLTTGILASPGHLEAACEAARAMRMHRAADAVSPDEAMDDLEAGLLGGEATAWN